MNLEYRTASSEFAEELVALELRCFPNVDPADLLSVAGVRLQATLFPEGAFMVLDGERVVAMASGVFVNYDITEPQHVMDEVVGPLGVEFHDPDGEWYYGIDIAVDPEYRGRGIAKRLYELRKQVVIDHDKRGIIAGGVIPGYADHKDTMTAAEYVDAVVRGDLRDPTLSVQLSNGFEATGVIADYVHDESTDNWASFIVWKNPQYRTTDDRQPTTDKRDGQGST